MSITEHPSYTHSLRPDVISSRSSGDTNGPAQTVAPVGTPDRSAAGLLTVRPWWDPDLAINGHQLDDPYVEMFWLGVLGPSVICLLRRFARGFARHPEGFRLSVRDTARAIGVGTGTGRNGPLNRTIDRACTFHIMRRTTTDEIDVRLHLPSLSRRQLSRLPVSVQNTHREWESAHGAGVGQPARSSGSTSVTGSTDRWTEHEPAA